jgi:hypothetical protein
VCDLAIQQDVETVKRIQNGQDLAAVPPYYPSLDVDNSNETVIKANVQHRRRASGVFGVETEVESSRIKLIKSLNSF